MDMKERNRLSILNTIRRGQCSRVEISSKLGMSKPAVSALVDELLQEDLIVETGRGDSTEAGGKRPILLDLNPKYGIVLAVHFNNERFEVALANLMGELIAYQQVRLTVMADYRVTLGMIVQEAHKLLAKHRLNEKMSKLIGCGISVKGLIETSSGILRYSAGFPEWRDVPIAAAFEEALHVPVFVENDARASTFALLHGEQGIKSNIATVNVGLGIGTGVAVQGEVYHGSHDGAVTFAHTMITSDGPQCDCGKFGCWESLASISALLKELARRDPSYSNLAFSDVVDKYNNDDATVKDVLLNYTAYWLGMGISNMLGVFDPEQLFILGDITLAPQDVRDRIIQTANAHTAPVSRQTPITFVENSAGKFLIQAAASVMIEQFFTLKYHRVIQEKTVGRREAGTL
jgi:predicted NBD/HSP70 family sugar kinase